jgi:hypothetical protein
MKLEFIVLLAFRQIRNPSCKLLDMLVVLPLMVVVLFAEMSIETSERVAPEK